MSDRKQKSKSRYNGEGSLYFDKNKQRWYGVVTVGYDANDKPIRKKVSDKDFKKAQKLFSELKEQVRKGTFIEKKDDKLEDIIIYLIERDKAANEINENTYKRRMDTLKVVQQSPIARMSIQSIDEKHIVSFLNSVTYYSQSYIKQIYEQIRGAFDYAEFKNLINKSPFAHGTEYGIRQPKSKKETKKIKALTIEEQRKFVQVLQNEEADNKYRCIYELMLCTGMRGGEVLALDKKVDIIRDFRKISVRRTITRDVKGKPMLGDVPKTENGRRVLSMNNSCLTILDRYINNEWKKNRFNLLFYDIENDKLITTNQVNSNFKRLIKKYDIIPHHEEMKPLSEKGRDKVAYKKYTYYKKKAGGGFELLGKNPPADWARNFKKYYYLDKVAEKDYNLHMLRHTFATRCIESGMPAKVLQVILGHADVETTLNIYCDVFEEYENKALQKAEEYMQSLSLTG